MVWEDSREADLVDPWAADDLWEAHLVDSWEADDLWEAHLVDSWEADDLWEVHLVDSWEADDLWEVHLADSWEADLVVLWDPVGLDFVTTIVSLTIVSPAITSSFPMAGPLPGTRS